MSQGRVCSHSFNEKSSGSTSVLEVADHKLLVIMKGVIITSSLKWHMILKEMYLGSSEVPWARCVSDINHAAWLAYA
jgi:hypothetical protein